MNQNGFVAFLERSFFFCHPRKLPQNCSPANFLLSFVKLKIIGQICWSTVNGSFGPLEPTLRTPFTDNRIKSSLHGLLQGSHSLFPVLSVFPFRNRLLCLPMSPPDKWLPRPLSELHLPCYMYSCLYLSFVWMAFSPPLCFQISTQIPPSPVSLFCPPLLQLLHGEFISSIYWRNN